MAMRMTAQRRVFQGLGNGALLADVPLDGDSLLLDDRHPLEARQGIYGYEAR